TRRPIGGELEVNWRNWRCSFLRLFCQVPAGASTVSCGFDEPELLQQRQILLDRPFLNIHPELLADLSKRHVLGVGQKTQNLPLSRGQNVCNPRGKNVPAWQEAYCHTAARLLDLGTFQPGLLRQLHNLQCTSAPRFNDPSTVKDPCDQR